MTDEILERAVDIKCNIKQIDEYLQMLKPYLNKRIEITIETENVKPTKIVEHNNFARLLDEISRYSPAEIIVSDMMFNSKTEIEKIKERFETYISKESEESFDGEYELLSGMYNIIDDKNEKIKNLSYKKLTIYSVVINIVMNLLFFVCDAFISEEVGYYLFLGIELAIFVS